MQCRDKVAQAFILGDRLLYFAVVYCLVKYRSLSLFWYYYSPDLTPCTLHCILNGVLNASGGLPCLFCFLP